MGANRQQNASLALGNDSPYLREMSSADFDEVIRAAREQSRTMTPQDREEQTRNFAAGNVGIEDPRVTREVVDRAAQQHARLGR